MNVCVRVCISLLKEFFISHWFSQPLEGSLDSTSERRRVGAGLALPSAGSCSQSRHQPGRNARTPTSYLHHEYKDGPWLPGRSDDEPPRMGFGEKQGDANTSDDRLAGSPRFLYHVRVTSGVWDLWPSRAIIRYIQWCLRLLLVFS